MANLNINQFTQVPVRGQLDLQTIRSGVIQGLISANQATALKAGDFVKLDSAITAGQFPQFVAAASTDSSMFALAFDVKKSSFVAGDICDITFFGGPVMWVVANGTINPGQAVESVGGSGTNVQVLAAAKQRGICIDPGVASALVRIIITNATQS